CLPGDFRGAEYCRILRLVDVRAGWEKLRTSSNAARIEQLQIADIAAEEAAEVSKSESVLPFDEERSLLGEECLERRKVHDCRIDFDLTEIRIECRVE